MPYLIFLIAGWCIFLPSFLVLSILYQLLDLVLKSPRATIEKGSFELECLKLIQDCVEVMQDHVR